MRRFSSILLVLVVVVSAQVAADGDVGVLNRSGGPLQLALVAETGFVGIPYHQIQIGSSGTRFDYVSQGGQEILFPFSRLSAELAINERHEVVFLYQPLELETESIFRQDVTVDGVTFQSGQVVDITYSFPFYRVSYLYDVAPSQAWEVGLGASFQIRNASIRFRSIDRTTGIGEELAISQNLGPVPILKARVGYTFADSAIPGAFVQLEADGFYASSAFINGAQYPFEGSIFDVSLRAGWQPQPGLEVFVNARALGGGASGTRGEAADAWTESRQSLTDNFLVSTSLTLGARLR